jgi:hypothetical protein
VRAGIPFRSLNGAPAGSVGGPVAQLSATIRRYCLTTARSCGRSCPSSLMEGRLPETVLKGGAGSGVLRPRLVTADSGGPGHRPPGMMTWLRGARCTDPEAMPEMGSAAPGRKSPRWSAERRASRVMGRAAPRRVRIGRASPARQQNKCACRRSARPSIGDGRDHEDTTRAQKRAAGTKKTALFDIVRPDSGRRLMRAPRLRARYDEPQPEAVGWVEFLRDPTMAPQATVARCVARSQTLRDVGSRKRLDPTYDCFESLALGRRKPGRADLRARAKSRDRSVR